MMTYLIKNSDKIKDEESYNMKLENYQFLAKDLMKTFNTLERTQTKHLSKLKEALDDLQKVFLADQKAQDSRYDICISQDDAGSTDYLIRASNGTTLLTLNSEGDFTSEEITP